VSARTHIGRLIVASTLLVTAAASSAATLSQIKTIASAGHADEAIQQLHSFLAASPDSVPAHSLLCTVYGSTEHFDEAIRECETAVRLAPSSSDAQLHLARVYGAKAGNSGAFTGMKLVSHIRGAFEKAVQLDGSNVEALSDLGEFYVDAPSIVGGGTDKARPLAQKLLTLNPARGHRLLGMIATKTGDTATAEAEFQKANDIKHSPESYVDFANFYQQRKQWDKAADSAVTAIRRDTEHGPDSIDAAKLLLKLNRNVDIAQQALRDYLNSSEQSAAVPAFRIHTMLGQSLLKQGNRAAAQQEFAAALALAHDYAPARKGAAQ
jgi:tetratricopeptide (TPR) repeat protein